MANGYSGLDFPNVHAEIAYWLTHTSALFRGGQNGSGENGNDFAMPTGTPVYAVAGGTVKGSGYYPGGGVVAVEQSPNRVWYYQHLDLTEAAVGQSVKAGQLIGYSGGQNNGGHHPSTPTYSSYPHIEVGIDAPWGGIWAGQENVVNGVPQSIDPRPFLIAILNGKAAPTSGASKSGIGSTLFAGSIPGSKGPSGGTGGSSGSSSNKTAVNCQFPLNPFAPGAMAAYITCLSNQGVGISAALIGIFGAVPWGRVVKVVVGSFLLFSAVLVLIIPDAAGVLTAVAGAPEAAPAVASTLRHPFKPVNPTRIASRVVVSRQQEKLASARAYTNYQTTARRYREKQQRQQIREYQLQQQRQAQQAPQQQPQQAKVTKPLAKNGNFVTGALPVLPKSKLGATANPMSAEDIANIPRNRRREGIESFIKQNQALIDMKQGTPDDQEQYRQNVEKGNEALSRMPPVQRGPKTQLRLVNPLTEIPRLARQVRQNSMRRAQRGAKRQLTVGDITKQPPTKQAQKEKESNASRQAFLQGKSTAQGSVDDILKDLRGE